MAQQFKYSYNRSQQGSLPDFVEESITLDIEHLKNISAEEAYLFVKKAIEKETGRKDIKVL